MDLTIIPYESVGSIKFGMSRLEVRQTLGAFVEQPDEPYLPEGITQEDVDFVDAFKELGVEVIYERKFPHVCIAISMYEPAAPIFNGRNLLEEPIEDSKEWLEAMDGEVEIIIEGVISYRFGIFLQSSYYDECKSDPPNLVGAFIRGYLDDE
jgi:hypothetical protein